MAYQLFDSSIVKKQTDGDIVLSSFLDEGEELVKSSFYKEPSVPQRSLVLTATRATFTSSENSFTVNVPDSTDYPIINEILAGKYRHSALQSSFTDTDLYANDVAWRFPLVAVFRNPASAGTVDLVFDFSGADKFVGNPNFEVYPWFSKNLDDHTVIRVDTDGTTDITLPSAS